MNKIIALVVVGMIVAILAGSYVTNYNYGNSAEKGLVAAYDNNRNILGQYTIRLREQAQIPSMQTDDLERLFNGSLGARYGADGSQAAMQWIREQNPNLDQSTYIQLQRTIEAGRTKFENEQTKFIDIKRAYETNLGYLWKGFWLGVAGYPKINLDDYNIVTSAHAEESFSTGIDTEVKLR